MRSRPLTTPSLQTSTYTSNHNHNTTSVVDGEALQLAASDLETNQLLPRRYRRHCVRIQGRLTTVRIVSVANLQHAKTSSPTTHMDINFEDIHRPRRLGSNYESEAEDDNNNEGSEDDVAECDAQFRGYGIGGAGNIRRQMDITPSASPSLLSLIHLSSSPSTAPLDTGKLDKSRRRIAALLRRLGNYKGKDKTSVDD